MSKINIKNTVEKLGKKSNAVEKAFSTYLRSRIRRALELAGGTNMDLNACAKEINAIAVLLADFHKTK